MHNSHTIYTKYNSIDNMVETPMLSILHVNHISILQYVIFIIDRGLKFHLQKVQLHYVFVCVISDIISR